MQEWQSDDKGAATTLQLIAEFSTDVIARVTPQLTFSYVSPSVERVFLRSVADTVGHPVAEFVVPEDLPLLAAATRRVVSGDTRDAIVTVRVIRGDGTIIWVEVASRLIGERVAGQPGDRAVVMRDVSQRKALEDALKAAAMNDGLTGLANRRAFDEALANDWNHSQRERGQLSLLLIDIDHFKAFNDSHGHQRGDECLRRVADALAGVARRRSDMVARYGGEEFAMILRGTDTAGAALLAEKARTTVAAMAIPHPTTAEGIVTISAGVVTVIARGGMIPDMPEALLAAADRALYAGKAAGRNRWVAAPPHMPPA